MNIFITGTDTNVGKTTVTAGLAAVIKNMGYSVGVFKPVQTGAVEINNEFVSADIEFVKSVNPGILTGVSYNFKEPAAPLLAAQLEGTIINPAKIKHDYEKLANKCDFILVEGAGGLLVPISNNFLMRDLIKMLDLPLIIVARPDLGTINHTLLTIEAAKNKNIKILGVIISGYPPETCDIAIKNAPKMIEDISGEKILGILPKIENLESNPSLIRDIFKEHVNMDFILNCIYTKMSLVFGKPAKPDFP